MDIIQNTQKHRTQSQTDRKREEQTNIQSKHQNMKAGKLRKNFYFFLKIQIQSINIINHSPWKIKIKKIEFTS